MVTCRMPAGSGKIICRDNRTALRCHQTVSFLDCQDGSLILRNIIVNLAAHAVIHMRAVGAEAARHQLVICVAARAHRLHFKRLIPVGSRHLAWNHRIQIFLHREFIYNNQTIRRRHDLHTPTISGCTAGSAYGTEGYLSLSPHCFHKDAVITPLFLLK